MDVSYRKDLRHNYLVISKIDNSNAEAYCVNMLQANSIDGIIKPESRNIDNQVQYYYDITSKQSVETIYIKNTIKLDKLKKLFVDLANLIEQAYEYLLNENDLIIKSDQIYIDLTTERANVAYLPGYNKDLEAQMITLIEYLMNKVEYNDKEAVLYIYNLYAACRDEGFSFNNLLSVIRESKPPRGVNIIKDIKQEVPPKEHRENIQIPVMMEKISDESEAYYYPLRTYIYTGACILGATLVLIIVINMRIIYTSIGNRIDYGKLMALLLILIFIIGYLMKIIWNKNNRLTRIISKQEYIDPRVDYSHKLQADNKSEHIKKEYEYTTPKKRSETTDVSEDKTESTVLLNADIPSCGCCLEPEDMDTCNLISITDSPFVIGKQKSNVDYFLDKEVVSRYHVKITQEEENHYITDLNSTNGTSLNDKPLSCYQRHKLTKDDKVSIAGINYIFKI